MVTHWAASGCGGKIYETSNKTSGLTRFWSKSRTKHRESLNPHLTTFVEMRTHGRPQHRRRSTAGSLIIRGRFFRVLLGVVQLSLENKFRRINPETKLLPSSTLGPGVQQLGWFLELFRCTILITPRAPENDFVVCRAHNRGR